MVVELTGVTQDQQVLVLVLLTDPTAACEVRKRLLVFLLRILEGKYI